MRTLEDSITYLVMERRTASGEAVLTKWATFAEDKEHEAHARCARMNSLSAMGPFVVVQRTVSEHLRMPTVDASDLDDKQPDNTDKCPPFPARRG